MPVYTWECEHCRRQAEVRASVETRDKQQPEINCCDQCAWRRILTPATTIRGAGWGGGKGRW